MIGVRLLLPLRFALREMRGGARGFAVFIACIAVGVTAIAGVGSVAASLADGLARQGGVILGGDLSFTLVQREANAKERQFLDDEGRVSAAATMRAMVQTADRRSALVELKAVDGRYPLYGDVVLSPAMPLPDALASRNGAFGAAVDPTLLARLDLKVGDRIHLGQAALDIRAVLADEPDKLASGIGFGPRLLVSDSALRASGLLQPGSLVRWHYRVRLNDPSPSRIAAVSSAAERQFPEAGWDIRTRDKASPSLQREVERFTEYLTLVGLTALLIGGVGVASAVRAHLDRCRETIATLKALGAPGRDVFGIYLSQVLIFAIVSTVVGVVIGAVLPFALASFLRTLMPLPLEPGLQPDKLALAALYGLFTALAFALWPLGRAQDVPVSALFRGDVETQSGWPRRRYIVATAVLVLALAGLAVALSYDRQIAAFFVVAAGLVFVALRLVAALLMWVARHAPSPRFALLRLAIANMHRPGALTPSIVLSLGLGLALLVVITQIDGNLRRQFTAALPDKAPSFYFIDIPSAQASAFNAFLAREAPGAKTEQVPMLRGRIVAVHGVKAENLHPDKSAAWVLQSDRGITYASEAPRGSRVVAGKWWPADVTGPPLVSVEKKVADGLGLKVGDTITVNVLGRNLTAAVANLRAVDWESLGINFVMVFSPNALRGAPHSEIATLTFPNGGSPAAEIALLKRVAASFPTVTAIRVKEAIDAVANLVGNLVLAIRAASLVTIVTAVLVLGGALAAGHRQRVYDAVILKTLGATRWRLLAGYACEYLLLGLATTVFGVIVGSLAAGVIVRDLMTLPFIWLAAPAIGIALAGLLVTLVLGLAGTFSALGQKPAPVLRNL